ncbi:hypothetical protein Cgig2_023647 [Carnegiea gigantea]|uniref:Uncharacterized protein n=1 Tax=Carnegiea gigantea TaxID=171969 RepID=A0A9Q1Q574_9CARY|nr:hypothetical protein Cgig2_023647 [Carnegiea gigantea]
MRFEVKKPWYQKAVEMTTLWKIIFKTPTTTNSTLWKTINSTEVQAPSNPNNNNPKQKLRKCTSLKVATTFTRVCLCAPISSYNEVFNGELLPPRRSYSYPRSASNNSCKQPFPAHSTHTHPQPPTTLLKMRVPSGRHSIEGRRVFRGKSLTDDVLMKRFVIEEEAMMQVRRRNQMEIIRRRAALKRRRKLGPSPLSRMVLAEEDDDQLKQEL